MPVQKIKQHFLKYQFFQVINLIVKQQKKTEHKNILIYRVSIPSRIKMYDFSKNLKNGKVKHLSFSETTLKQLL